MEIGQFNSFNAMEQFNKMSAQNNGMELGKFQTPNVLEGHISMDVPSISNMQLDEATMKDLNALNISPVSSNENINSADSFYKSLGNAMSDGIQNVNKLQREADDAKEFFASGGNIDIHSVMIASQKAQMGMEMAMQLRNKMISAYNDVIKMSF